MIFLTVGSMFPFDRLVQSVDRMLEKRLIEDTIIAQIGDGQYQPGQMAFDRYIAKPDYDQRLADAQMLIGHAGAGTIALALKYRKPLLVVPRLRKFKEHVNDHQVVTARKYEALGYVLVAYDMQDIPAKLAELKKFKPRRREAHPQNLARRIGEYLGTLLPAEPVDAKNAQAPSTSAMRERTTGACKPDDFRGASAKDGSRNRHTAPAHAPD